MKWPMKWLVVTGTVNEGFSFHGPFDGPAKADEWARQQPFSPHYLLAEYPYVNKA